MRANPDNWKMKVKNFFHTLRRQISTTCLYALPLAVAITLQNCFLLACTLCAPPLQHSRSAPGIWWYGTIWMCCNCTVPLFGCNSHCMSLQVPIHLPTFQLSQLVPPVSEFLGLLQPLELLWWGIGYTIRQKEARTLTQTPAVWTLVLVQLNTPCLVFREAFVILSPWLPSHGITWALWLVL